MTFVRALAALCPWRRWTVVRVHGGSMEPTLHDGDVLLARRLCGDAPHRGDIVVLRRPRSVAPPPGSVVVHSGASAVSGSPWLIKRVAAVPGDPVPPGVPCPGTVPAGMVVVLGDSPGFDSLLFGAVPLDTVHARVTRALR